VFSTLLLKNKEVKEGRMKGTKEPREGTRKSNTEINRKGERTGRE
jgi:hypothetical protein